MKAHGLARLGRDAEVRYTSGGKTVCTLSLAFDVRGKDGKETTWVKAALWGERAESLAPYLTKGSMHLFDLSDVRMESWESDKGSKTDIVANVVDVTLGPKREGHQEPQEGPKSAPREKAAPTPAAGAKKAPSGFDDMEDDIPF